MSRPRQQTPPAGYLSVGEAVKPQGIRGELRILSTTDTPQVWEGITSVGYFGRSGEWTVSSVTACRVQKDTPIAKLEGIDDRNTAETMRGTQFYAHRDILAPLMGDRFFIVDLIGCTVRDETGREIGKVTEVMQPGANDVYVVSGSRGEVLLPAIGSLVRSIDVQEKTITVDSLVMDEVAVYED